MQVISLTATSPHRLADDINNTIEELNELESPIEIHDIDIHQFATKVLPLTWVAFIKYTEDTDWVKM